MTRKSAAALIAAALSLGAACSGGGGGNGTAVTTAPAPTLGDPTNVDLAKLRIAVAEDRVLVKSRSRPFIRADEYNAWLGTYPLSITEASGEAAQRQAIDQMVDFRLLHDWAVAAGYASKDGVGGDARSIVLRYLSDQIRDVGGVSDAEAQRYYEAHREQLVGLDAAELPPEIRLATLKGSVRGAQLAARLEAHKKEADVEILLTASGLPERN